MNTKEEFLAILQDAVDETGVELQQTVNDVAAYAATRAEHLAMIVDQPGFAKAVRAERDSVCLYAGVAVAGDLTAVDGAILGVVKGMLMLAAKVLAA